MLTIQTDNEERNIAEQIRSCNFPRIVQTTQCQKTEERNLKEKRIVSTYVHTKDSQPGKLQYFQGFLTH